MIQEQDDSEGNKHEFIQEVKVILEKELFDKIIIEVNNMEECMNKLNRDIHKQQHH